MKQHFIKVTCPNEKCDGEIVISPKKIGRDEPDYPEPGRLQLKFDEQEYYCKKCGWVLGYFTLKPGGLMFVEFKDLDFLYRFLDIVKFQDHLVGLDE